LRKSFSALLAILLVAASASAFQNKPSNLSGKYQGVAKNDQIGEIPLTVEIKDDGGKLSGKIDTPQGPSNITSGSYADGKVSLKFDAGGNEGTVTATADGDKITGKWELAGMTGPLELKRANAAAATPPAAPSGSAPAGSAGDPVTGEWAATADAGGNTIPFTLKLKLEGDKVTGTSESDQGSVPLNKGSYTAGKLSFQLDTGQGSITLTGMVKDGKILGDFDFAGQMTGKWEAKKK
jgi:major membrane immunogen (membrane-anchored lipoprotein)